MTEEEKERFEDLENLLPCHIYRLENDKGESSYRLYDGGFHEQDETQQQPLSLRLHQEECSICLMEYEDREKLSSSHNPKCPHAFHRECIKRWLVSNSECPCCRKGFLEFEDSDDDEATIQRPLTARFASLTTSFQHQIRQMRQGIENRLEPIILRLEQERQATIDPNNNNDRRSRTDNSNNRERNHNDTQNQYDEDDYDERSDDRPITTQTSLLQDRIGRIREGLSGRLDIVRVRIMEQTTIASRIAWRGSDNDSDAESIATTPNENHDHAPHTTSIATTIDGPTTSNDHRNVNDDAATTSSLTVNDDVERQQETTSRPNLLTATTSRVLEMGSARWNDVTMRITALGESFRVREEAESPQSPSSHPLD